MMRVAFVGNSHMEAYEGAMSELQERYRDLKIFFFGLPNPVFFDDSLKPESPIYLETTPDFAPKQMIVSEGPEQLNFADFDIVFLTAHGFYFHRIVTAMAQLDILGYPKTHPDRVTVSMPCFEDIVDTAISSYFKRLETFFGHHANAVVIQAPFPTVDIIERDDSFKRLAEHPARDDVFKLFQAELINAGVKSEMTVLPVPTEVLEIPFFTQTRFAREEICKAGQSPKDADMHHMNKDYAAISISDYFADLMLNSGDN